LRRVLQQPALLATIVGYGTFDTQAGLAQKEYKGICKRTLFALSFASMIALVAVVAPWPDPYDGYLRWTAIVIVYCAMILAFVSLRTLDRANPYKRWHQQRANAELMRGQLFKSVMEAPAVGEIEPGELPLLPLKLEYVRRYHLDIQRTYYRKRADEHARRIEHASRWRKAGAIVIVVWVGCALIAAATPLAEPVAWLAPVQWLFGFFEWVETGYLDAILLFVGLCMMLGYGLALAMSSISNDLRNAGRYRAYAKRVDTFHGRLPEVQTLALGPANADKVSAFVAEVQDLFDTEQRDWKMMQELEESEPAPPKPRFSLASLNPFRPSAPTPSRHRSADS
jgi:hypothetical protein